jgi:hypothetical protein
LVSPTGAAAAAAAAAPGPPPPPTLFGIIETLSAGVAAAAGRVMACGCVCVLAVSGILIGDAALIAFLTLSRALPLSSALGARARCWPPIRGPAGARRRSSVEGLARPQRGRRAAAWAAQCRARRLQRLWEGGGGGEDAL